MNLYALDVYDFGTVQKLSVPAFEQYFCCLVSSSFFVINPKNFDAHNFVQAPIVAVNEVPVNECNIFYIFLKFRKFGLI